MVTDVVWNELEAVLRGCFPAISNTECEYLKGAFVATERMWAENFAKIATVKFVMLGEAPQFGPGARYFYNVNAPFSAFLHFKDANAILGDGFARGRADKRFLHAELARAGFIIMDLFPFALNENDTPSIYWSKMSDSLHRELFQRTAPVYFDRKRDLVLQRGSPLFLFRYQRQHRILGDLVNAELSKRQIGPSECVGGSNMPLDRKKLQQVCLGT
jgi:hypothetical protein